MPSFHESTKPKRPSAKQHVKGKVKAKCIDYAMSNPEEVVKCIARSKHPKRRIALQAYGIKGKMNADEGSRKGSVVREVLSFLENGLCRCRCGG